MRLLQDAIAAAARQDRAAVRLGVITSTPGDGTVGVTVGGTDLLLPHASNYTPRVNDSALILADEQRWIVIGAYTNPSDPVVGGGTAPVPSSPPPPAPVDPAPVKTYGTKVFLAQSTGCFRAGKWRTDTRNQPHQGDWGGYGINTGAWFYGNQIPAALAGAAIIKVEIWLRRLPGGVYGGVQPTIWTMPHGTRPSGDPTREGGGFDAASIAVGEAKWVTLPDHYGAAMLAGTAKGLACFTAGSDPYAVFANLTTSRSSGAIRIRYRKG